MPKGQPTAQNPGRINFPYFEGINSLIVESLARPQELERAENMRSVVIGSLEKRRGYALLGNDLGATANYGVFYFETTSPYPSASISPSASESPSISPSASTSISPSSSLSPSASAS